MAPRVSQKDEAYKLLVRFVEDKIRCGAKTAADFPAPSDLMEKAEFSERWARYGKNWDQKFRNHYRKIIESYVGEKRERGKSHDA